MKTATPSTGNRALNGPARRWLETAAQWRLLSLLFRLPTRESRRELSRLAAGAPEALGNLAREQTAVSLKAAAAEFHRVFGPGGIPAVESSYDPNALAGRGPLLADIAGFHRAFAYQPEKPPAEVPDHIAAELDFLSFLAMKVAFALHEGQEEASAVTRQAYERFQQEHLWRWLPAFRERLERSGSPVYVQAVAFLDSSLASATRHAGPR